jgi:hypothetical protein
MKIGARFYHKPTKRNGICKGNVSPAGKIRALMDDGHLYWVLAADCVARCVGRKPASETPSPRTLREPILATKQPARIYYMEQPHEPSEAFKEGIAQRWEELRNKKIAMALAGQPDWTMASERAANK